MNGSYDRYPQKTCSKSQLHKPSLDTENCECETDNLNCYFTSCILSIYHAIPSFHKSREEAL